MEKPQQLVFEKVIAFVLVPHVNMVFAGACAAMEYGVLSFGFCDGIKQAGAEQE